MVPGRAHVAEMATSSIIEIPDYWRSRAEEARVTADAMRDLETKRSMLGIAAGYDHMALRAEARITAKTVSRSETDAVPDLQLT